MELSPVFWALSCFSEGPEKWISFWYQATGTFIPSVVR
jgi:hypothetical protein